MKPRKKIALLQTGGTIAMLPTANEALGFPEARPADFIRTHIPALFELADLSVFDLFFEDSSNLNPDHWTKIISALEKLWPSFDGFVILHGTDTMAFTASALSFAIKNPDKPVILTGSQIPMSNLRTDARRNLINAMEVSTHDITEVAICFNDAVYRGNRSTKLNIADFNAFSSPNFPTLADIGLHIDLHQRRLIRPETGSSVQFLQGFNPKVFVLRLFPGLIPSMIVPMLPKLNALVIEGFGCGNFPVTGPGSLLPLLEQAYDLRLPVVMASQAVYDAVDLNKYESGKKALAFDVWSAADMTIEATVTKLMWALYHFPDPDERKHYFHLSTAGERSTSR